MTEPTIVISFDDLVKHKGELQDMKWTDKAAEDIYNSFVDESDNPHEDVGEVGGTKIIVICPESQTQVNNIQTILFDLKISHHSDY